MTASPAAGVHDGPRLMRDAIRARRSIRVFADHPVPRDVVLELLEDAVWAPSPHNAQPWRFTVLFQPAEKEGLARGMAARLEDELRLDGMDESAIERLASRSRTRVSSAPVVLLCSLVRDGLVSYPDSHRDHLEWEMAVQSVGAVLQTLFLLAAQQGLGTCWMAAPMYCPDVVRHVLALPPEYAPQALVLMGYPGDAGRVRKRRPVREVVDLR